MAVAAQPDGLWIDTGALPPSDPSTRALALVPPDTVISPTGPNPDDQARTDTQSPSTARKSTGTASLPAPMPFVHVPRPAISRAEYTFDMRGQWEGVVTDIRSDDFSVVLRDLVNPASAEYEAVFSIDEVADDDRKLLKAGAIFYWTIGYQQRRGQRLRVSEVRFRRLPAWSRSDMERIKKAAHALDDLFGP